MIPDSPWVYSLLLIPLLILGYLFYRLYLLQYEPGSRLRRGEEELKRLDHRILIHFGVPILLLFVVALIFHHFVEEGHFPPLLQDLDAALLVTAGVLVVAWHVAGRRVRYYRDEARKRAGQQSKKPPA